MWAGSPLAEKEIRSVKCKEFSSLTLRIIAKSKESSLVITNLPYLMPNQKNDDFLSFIDKATAGLKRVLLIRNTGKEVVTQYT